MHMEHDSKDWYIHIAEAVKKYNKTRQTFYNYIHKGIIESKKVHNKVYLKISDIEGLQSNYLDENTGAYVYDTESDTYTFSSTEEENTVREELEEKVHHIEQQFSSQLSQVRDQNTFHRNAIEEHLKNEIHTTGDLLQNRLDSLSSSFFLFQWQVHKRHKKLFFYITYLLFIVLNTAVLKILFSL